MMIDEGTLLVLRSANGAFSCRAPPLPREWNPVDRPHVANLVHLEHEVFRVFLSTPIRRHASMHYDLAISELEHLPVQSISIHPIPLCRFFTQVIMTRPDRSCKLWWCVVRH